MPRRRVLCLTSNFPRWASDSTTPFVLHLARDLADFNYEVDVLAPHAPGAAIEEELDGLRVRRFRYAWPDEAQTVCYQGGALINLRKRPFEKWKLPAFVAAETQAALSLVQSGEYDLVHSHWLLPQGFVGGLVGGLGGLPRVTTIHGGDLFSLKSPPLSWFKRRALALADAVTVNSSFTLGGALELGAESGKTHVIPMGVHADPLNDAEKSRAAELRAAFMKGKGPLLITVGRLVEEKGVGDVISALESLRELHPDARLLVVGEGQDRSAFEEKSKSLGLTEHVLFLGWVTSSEVRAYLACADVFVGASKQAADGWVEAQGLTFLEAMISGVPVVATASGGIVDSVIHRETGLLVNEGRPREIADAVCQILDDASLREQILAGGRERAELFSRNRSALKFANLFDSLIEAK